jgi:hypothetical protein
MTSSSLAVRRGRFSTRLVLRASLDFHGAGSD